MNSHPAARPRPADDILIEAWHGPLTVGEIIVDLNISTGQLYESWARLRAARQLPSSGLQRPMMILRRREAERRAKTGRYTSHPVPVIVPDDYDDISEAADARRANNIVEASALLLKMLVKAHGPDGRPDLPAYFQPKDYIPWFLNKRVCK